MRVPEGYFSDHDAVPVMVYSEELIHHHGKGLSGLTHAHPLRPLEDPDHVEHEHDDAGPSIAYYPR